MAAAAYGGGKFSTFWKTSEKFLTMLKTVLKEIVSRETFLTIIIVSRETFF